MRWTALLLAAALAGCAPRAGAEVSGSGWKARLEWSPARPRALHPVTLRLRVEDGFGTPLALHRLRATASMPEMGHEAEEISFRRTAAGTYEAHHTFSMDGRWVVRVEGVDSVRVVAVFGLDVGP